jgi:hypothetical protein
LSPPLLSPPGWLGITWDLFQDHFLVFFLLSFPVVGCLGVPVFPFPFAFSIWSLVATGSREHFLGPTLTWMALAIVSIASKPILGFAILPISFGFGRLLALFLIFHFSWIPPFSFGWYLDHFTWYICRLEWGLSVLNHSWLTNQLPFHHIFKK